MQRLRGRRTCPPSGVRIDRIDVVPETPVRDPGDDGAWFLTTDYRLHTSAYDPETDVSWSFIHELGHQIGLIDLYNLDVPATAVQVTDATGEPVNLGFQWPRPGVMGGGDAGRAAAGPLFSTHDVLGALSNKGYRRGYFGEYQYDIPRETALRVLDNTGLPAQGVDVALFQRARGDVPSIDDVPEITGTTGADGRLALPNRPAWAWASPRPRATPCTTTRSAPSTSWAGPTASWSGSAAVPTRSSTGWTSRPSTWPTGPAT